MENNIEKSCVEFSTSQMLKWMEYVADMQGVTPEKIKLLNTCGKRRNVLATIATHKRILIFADETHPNNINAGKQAMATMKCILERDMSLEK